jgi:hypothetical protein
LHRNTINIDAGDDSDSDDFDSKHLPEKFTAGYKFNKLKEIVGKEKAGVEEPSSIDKRGNKSNNKELLKEKAKKIAPILKEGVTSPFRTSNQIIRDRLFESIKNITEQNLKDGIVISDSDDDIEENDKKFVKGQDADNNSVSSQDRFMNSRGIKKLKMEDLSDSDSDK